MQLVMSVLCGVHYQHDKVAIVVRLQYIQSALAMLPFNVLCDSNLVPCGGSPQHMYIGCIMLCSVQLLYCRYHMPVAGLP